MTTAHANLTYYKELNEQLRQIDDTEITIENAVGQRYLGCGSSGKTLTIHGTRRATSPASTSTARPSRCLATRRRRSATP